MYCNLIYRVKMKKETVALSSSCIISFSGTFLKNAMSLCWESGGWWQSARWSWQGPRGHQLPHRRHAAPGSWQLLKSNLEGEVVTSQGSAGKRRVGPGPFTVRVGVTVWLGFSDQLSIRITETKEHKIRITEQTQKECQGLKTEIMVRNLDYDNAFLK